MSKQQIQQPRPNVFDPLLTRPDYSNIEKKDVNKLWLDKNENSDPALQALIKSIFNEIPERIFSSYPELNELYGNLAENLEVEKNNLLLAAGSDGVIRSVFEAYISPGDKVIYTDPTFAMYSVYSRMYGADVEVIKYEATENDPEISAESIINTIKSHQPKLICIANPNSPTGTILSEDELKSIIEEAENIGALVLIDEAYYPFYSKTLVPYVNNYSNLIVTRTTAKAWGLAGIRVGYSITNEDINLYLHKVRPMYEIGAVSAYMFNEMLSHEQTMHESVKRLNDSKAYFLNVMNQNGLKTLNGHGNFLHVAFGKHEKQMHTVLQELVYYRQSYDDSCLKGFSRISSATKEQFQPLIDKILNVIKS